MSSRVLQRAAFVLGALLLGALWLMGVGASAQETAGRDELREEFHQSYPLSAQGRVTLKNLSGAVRITAWDRAEVRVDAVKHARTRERLDEAKIEIEASADSINVETRYPDEGMRFERDDPRRNPASVEYTLSVPRSAHLESVELISGALDIEGIAGGVNASCISGQLTARNLSGDAKLSNVSGMLEATFERLDATSRVTLNNVSGEIVLTIPSDTSGTLKANTLSGHIENNLGLPVRRGEHVGNEMAGQLGQSSSGNSGARLKVNNVSGQIKIQRAADGRTASRATSLISETSRERAGASEEDIRQQVEREVERAMQESEGALRETERAMRESEGALRETERALRETERTSRAGERANRASERAARAGRVTAAEDAQREAARIQREAEREATREVERHGREMDREAARAAGEAARDAAAERHAAAAGEWSYRLTEREEKSFPASGTPRVFIKTFDGEVNIESTDQPSVRFTATKRARDEQAMRGIRLRAEQTSEGIFITAEFDKSQKRENYDTGATVALNVYVPKSANVNVKSGDGRLRLTGINGEIELRTGDGAVDVSGSRGKLQVETGDGRVRITGFDGDASIQTGDGRITLDGRFTKLSARTGDGAISLALPAGVNARIETDSEHVSNDMAAVAEEAESESEERRIRHWRVGNGGAGGLFTLRTGDGQIYLRRAGDDR